MSHKIKQNIIMGIPYFKKKIYVKVFQGVAHEDPDLAFLEERKRTFLVFSQV